MDIVPGEVIVWKVEYVFPQREKEVGGLKKNPSEYSLYVIEN